VLHEKSMIAQKYRDLFVHTHKPHLHMDIIFMALNHLFLLFTVLKETQTINIHVISNNFMILFIANFVNFF